MRLLFSVLLIAFYPFCPALATRATRTRVLWDPEAQNMLQPGSVHTINVRMGQYMDMLCPQYDTDVVAPLSFNIYNVTEEQFQKCSPQKDTRIIFRCDSPNVSKKLTMKFQNRSPNPLGFIFHPGSTYYYIAFLDNPKKSSKCDRTIRLAVIVYQRNHHHVIHQSTTGTPQFTTTKSQLNTKSTLNKLQRTKQITTTKPGLSTTSNGANPLQHNCFTCWTILASLVSLLLQHLQR